MKAKNTASDMLAKLSKNVTLQRAKMLISAAQHATAELRREIYETFPSGRTGGLARSFRETFASSDGATIEGGSYSDLEYAAIQDEGGIIRPRVKKFLAVPVSGAKIAVGKWPRHWEDGKLTLIPRKGKPSLLAVVTKKKVTPKYVLLRSVKIKPKNYIERGADRAMPGIDEIAGEAVQIAADKSGGGNG
jgi:hypothetical protein